MISSLLRQGVENRFLWSASSRSIADGSAFANSQNTPRFLSARCVSGRTVRPTHFLRFWVDGKILVRKSQFDEWLERHRIQPDTPVDVEGIVNGLLKDAK
jgi:hypothetical protein